MKPGQTTKFARAQTIWVTLALLSACSLKAAPVSDNALATVTFDQNLNQQVSLDLPFVDEAGQQVRLGQYFGDRPVILVLGYYECPMLCSLVLNGMVEGLEDLKWSIGRDFEVVNVSINPSETAALAVAKKRSYLKRYGRANAARGWHFLTGQEQNSRRLAGQVGFHYLYDPVSKQYAHPSGLVVLTPKGKVSGYLFGVTFSPNQLYDCLRKASAQEVSSPIQKLVLLCFHYNPISGKYGPLIMMITRLLALATVLGLALLVGMAVRRDRARSRAIQPVEIPESVAPAQPASPPAARGSEPHRQDS